MDENSGYVQNLLEERVGYVRRELPDRVAAVDAELARFGVKVAKDGEVDMPDELQPEVKAVDAGVVETSTLETTDAKPDKAPASKPKK